MRKTLLNLLLAASAAFLLSGPLHAQQGLIADERLLGNDSGATGQVQQLTVGGGLGFSGTGGILISDPELDCIAGLTSAADKFPYFTGDGTCALADLSSAQRTWLTTSSSANFASVITDETGSGALVFANSPALVTPDIGTPSAGTLTNATGLPVSSGISGLGAGVATFLATPSSANLASAVTDETGSGALVFGTAPDITISSTTEANIIAAIGPCVGDAGSGGATGLVPAPVTGDATRFLRGDCTFVSIPGGGDLLSTNNLSDVADAATSLANLGGAALGTLNGLQLLTASSGTYTPTAGTSSALVILQAAGGGGGGVGTSAGTGRGGSAGAGETRWYVLTGVTGTYPYAVGALGAGATAGNNAGSTAADTTFGTGPLVTAKGGTGGGGSDGSNNGTVGTTPTGSGGIRIEPTSGPRSNAFGVQGGSSLFGAAGMVVGGVNFDGGGLGGGGRGRGGTGGQDTGTSARAGEPGAAGQIIVLEFK